MTAPALIRNVRGNENTEADNVVGNNIIEANVIKMSYILVTTIRYWKAIETTVQASRRRKALNRKRLGGGL